MITIVFGGASVLRSPGGCSHPPDPQTLPPPPFLPNAVKDGPGRGGGQYKTGNRTVTQLLVSSFSSPKGEMLSVFFFLFFVSGPVSFAVFLSFLFS